MRINSRLTYVAALLGLGLNGVFATAQTLSCGDTIGPGAFHVLTADVGPCDGDDAALTVVGPTVLLMNSFGVFCEDMDMDGAVPKGIVLTESSAIVFDGTVVGCDDGAGVEGEGNHYLQEIHVFGNADDGFDIDSDSNSFVGSSANGNGDNGFSVNGNSNFLVDNGSNGNEDRGFEVDGNNNFILHSRAQENGADGIRLDDGAFAILADNALVDNADDGIEINTNGNTVVNNEIQDNGEDGLQLSEGAENNIVVGNAALGNNPAGAEGAFDLEDQNPDCDSNVWLANSFGTRSQACIR